MKFSIIIKKYSKGNYLLTTSDDLYEQKVAREEFFKHRIGTKGRIITFKKK